MLLTRRHASFQLLLVTLTRHSGPAQCVPGSPSRQPGRRLGAVSTALTGRPQAHLCPREWALQPLISSVLTRCLGVSV